jgi:hypothetical protein
MLILGRAYHYDAQSAPCIYYTLLTDKPNPKTPTLYLPMLKLYATALGINVVIMFFLQASSMEKI